MVNPKGDKYYIRKIIEDLKYIVEHTKNVDKAEFYRDELLRDATLFHMIQLSESVKKLSSEIRQKRADIPWNEMYGMRNRIVHDYGNVDLSVVYDTVKEDIPELLSKFEEIGISE